MDIHLTASQVRMLRHIERTGSATRLMAGNRIAGYRVGGRRYHADTGYRLWMEDMLEANSRETVTVSDAGRAYLATLS